MSFLLEKNKKGINNNDRVRKTVPPSSLRRPPPSEGARILPRPQKGFNRKGRPPQSSLLKQSSSKSGVRSTGSQLLLQRQVPNTQTPQSLALQQRSNLSRMQTKSRTVPVTPQQQNRQVEVSGVISMTEGKSHDMDFCQHRVFPF